MTLPPSLIGGVIVSTALLSPPTATTSTGASGTIYSGVAGSDGIDGRLVPRKFVAVTVKV